MTSRRLIGLQVENFRSINERVNVRLDAPVVLIHGHNGAGKTSLLSAIELALTGDVPSLARVDDGYKSQLLHYGATSGEIALQVSDAEGFLQTMEVSLDGGRPKIEGTLGKKLAQFFSERCYLAQSSLSQLLTIYQESGAGLDSPLSRFVNELLGLDRLDALERGLKPSQDLRNTRKVVPAYLAVEGERDRLSAEHAAFQSRSQTAAREERSGFEALREALAQLRTQGIEIAETAPDLDIVLQDKPEAAELWRLSDVERRVSTARRTFERLLDIRASSQRESLEATLAETEKVLSDWRTGAGEEIAGLLRAANELVLAGPRTAEVNVAEDLRERREQWLQEVARLESMLKTDEAAVHRRREIEDELVRIDARLKDSTSQLGVATVDVGGLSRGLANVLPHIHGPECPVCQRDYSEVSEMPLADALARRIAELGDLAERLSQLTRDQAAAEHQKVELERDGQALGSRILTDDQRLKAQDRLAKVQALAASAERLQPQAAIGSELIARNTRARRFMEAWSSTDSEERALHEVIGELATAIGLTINWPTETLESALASVEETVAVHVDRTKLITELKDAARRKRMEVHGLSSYAQLAAKAHEDSKVALQLVEDAFHAAEALRRNVRQILAAVGRARVDVVSNVFNDRLNKVWRDLFVRLAPTEAFVPSFFLPTGGEVRGSPALRTVHRSGDTGGAPGVMLSAGNLNTAALTLFLALHLSVEAKLPWLLLDDPVQSMDDVHISQFAALLRTLSKEHGRQVFIAVHDRAIFDYLSLELSPAFEGDELITIEVSSSANGRTRYNTLRHPYKADEAIVATAA